MRELHKYYSKRLLLLLGLMLGATFALDSMHTELAKRHSAQWTLNVSNLLNHHVVVVALLFAGEVFIRKCLWRIEKPELDFRGRWYGTTTYTRRWLDEGTEVPDPAPHEVDIKQDCLGLAIAPTKADAFVQWHSLMCDLLSHRGIAYTYEVTYNHKEGWPSRARGYEVLRVVDTDSRGRPRVISGEFHHLVSDDKPVFSGVAQFDRVAKPAARWPRMPIGRLPLNQSTAQRP